MDLDGSMFYLIAFFGFFGASLVLWTMKLFTPSPAIYFARYIRYPLLIHSRWLRTTRLHAAICITFLFVNIGVILLPSFFPGWRQVQTRAAFMAVVNIAPLCMGGRAPIVETLNIPHEWYHMMHSWLGLVAVTEAVSHSVIALSLNPRSGQSIQTGWTSFGLLLGALFITFPLVRRALGRWFLWIHRATSLCAVSFLLSHVLNSSSSRAKILIGSSCGFWLATTLLRVSRLVYYWHTAEIIEVSGTTDVVQIEVSLNHPIQLPAGYHFYVFFPFTWYPMRHLVKYNLLHSFTAVPYWHDSYDASQSVSSLRFLLSRHGSHGSAISRLKEGQSILLDGPYGQDLGLQKLQNVILAAKGMGIAGVLPLALHLALRRNHDDRIRDRIQHLAEVDMELRKRQDKVSGEERKSLIKQKKDVAAERLSLSRKFLNRDPIKKVTIFWSLEANSQMEWLQEQLKSLQKLDPGNKLLIVWCGYPHRREGFEPFRDSRFWMCIDPTTIPSFDDLILSRIKAERARLSGSMGVITCGNRTFCNLMRESAIQSMTDMAVTFIETEYRPRRIVQGDIKPNAALVQHQFRDQGRHRQVKGITETELQCVTTALS